MDTFALIKELSKKSKKEIKYSLLALMLDGKIDFLDLNEAYIKYLIKEDRLNQLIEAETCVLESFHYKKGIKDEDGIHKGVCTYLISLNVFK